MFPSPTYHTLPSKNLIGVHFNVSLANNRTAELWRIFMPLRGMIAGKVNDDLISLQVYPSDYFSKFNPAREFVKWAAVEVTNVNQLPDGMEVFTLPGGMYAVFHYKGPAHNPAIFQYIYSTWLPGSGYVLDDRPHFEVLGEKYSNHDPESEEEIWIPVREKS